MSTPTSTPLVEKAARPRDSRRAHRWACIIGGGLAVIGGTLAAVADPLWAVLAVIGGLSLIAFPDSKCCAR